VIKLCNKKLKSVFRETVTVNKRVWTAKPPTVLNWEHIFKKSEVGHLLWPQQSILRENSNPEAKTYAISGLSISWPIPLSTSQYGNFSIWRQSWMENISIALDTLFWTNYPLYYE
jgi:hypothetical protein